MGVRHRVGERAVLRLIADDCDGIAFRRRDFLHGISDLSAVGVFRQVRERCAPIVAFVQCRGFAVHRRAVGDQLHGHVGWPNLVRIVVVVPDLVHCHLGGFRRMRVGEPVLGAAVIVVQAGAPCAVGLLAFACRRVVVERAYFGHVIVDVLAAFLDGQVLPADFGRLSGLQRLVEVHVRGFSVDRFPEFEGHVTAQTILVVGVVPHFGDLHRGGCGLVLHSHLCGAVACGWTAAVDRHLAVVRHDDAHHVGNLVAVRRAELAQSVAAGGKLECFLGAVGRPALDLLVVRIADEAQQSTVHGDVGMVVFHFGDGDLRLDVLLVVHHPQVQALRIAVHCGDGQRLSVHGGSRVIVGCMAVFGIGGWEHHVQRGRGDLVAFRRLDFGDLVDFVRLQSQILRVAVRFGDECLRHVRAAGGSPCLGRTVIIYRELVHAEHRVAQAAAAGVPVAVFEDLQAMRTISESAFGCLHFAVLLALTGATLVLVSGQGHRVDGHSVQALSGLEQHHGFICHACRSGVGHVDGQHPGRGVIERCRALDLALRLRVHDFHAALLQFHRVRHRVLQHQSLPVVERGAGGVHVDGVVDVWCRCLVVGRFLVHQLRRIDPPTSLIRVLGRTVDADHGAVLELAGSLQGFDVLQTRQIANLHFSTAAFRFGQRRAGVLEREDQGILSVLRGVGDDAYSVELRAGLALHRHAVRNVFHVGRQRVGDGHVLRTGRHVMHVQSPAVFAVAGIGRPVHVLVHVVFCDGMGRGLRGFAKGGRVVDRVRGTVLHLGGVHDVEFGVLRQFAGDNKRELLVVTRICDLVVRCGIFLGVLGIGVDLHIVVQCLPVAGGCAVVTAVRLLSRAVLIDSVRDCRAVKILLRGECGFPLDGGFHGSAGQGPLDDVAFGAVDGHGAGSVELVAVAILAVHLVGVCRLFRGIGIMDWRGVGDDVPAIAFRQCRCAVFQIGPFDRHGLQHGIILVVLSVAFNRHIAVGLVHPSAKHIRDCGIGGVAVITWNQVDAPVDVLLVRISRAVLVHRPLGLEHQASLARLVRGFLRLDRRLVIGDVQVAVLALRRRIRIGFACIDDLLTVHFDLVLHVQFLAVTHAWNGQREALVIRVRRCRICLVLVGLCGQSRVGEQFERIRNKGEQAAHRIGDGHIGIRTGGADVKHVVVDAVAVAVGFTGAYSAVLVDAQTMLGVDRRFDGADARKIPLALAAVAFVIGAARDLAVDGHIGGDAAAGFGAVGVGGNNLVALHGEGSTLLAGAVVHRIGGAVLEGNAFRQIVGEGGPLFHLYIVGHVPGKLDPDLGAIVERHTIGVVLPGLAAVSAELHLGALFSKAIDPALLASGQVIFIRLGVFRRNQHAGQQHAQHHGNGGKRFHAASRR